MKKNIEGIRPIDCDLIAEMKRNGQGWDANRLLEAYHKEKKKALNDAYNEQRRLDYRISKFKGTKL